MSWLILICSMCLMSSGHFSGAEDCNYSPLKVNAALTGLITAEKEEWRGQVDRWRFSISSVNDALVTLWEELSGYKEKTKPITQSGLVPVMATFSRFSFDKVFQGKVLKQSLC